MGGGRMADWAEGYVKDIGYTFGYHSELNPTNAKLAFLNAGVKFPSIHNACELGFGQGISINFHAAASLATWHGNDFNPAQVGFARSMSTITNRNVYLSDESFLEYCKRSDLPEFDFIGIHGIWSWVSSENRSYILNFIKKNLKVGGVVYIGYNTFPGWASFVPVRHLMNLSSNFIGNLDEGIDSRVNKSLDFAESVFNLDPLFVKKNPSVIDRLATIKKQNKNYVAHEFHNKEWHPDFFSNVALMLEEIKLEYVGSANYLEHVNEINFTDDQMGLLANIKNTVFRESVKDFMLNQQFRKDYWVKGNQRLSSSERKVEIRKITILLVVPRDEIPMLLNTYVGEVVLYESVYDPLLQILENHKQVTIGSLVDELSQHGIIYDQIIQAIMILVGLNFINFTQPRHDSMLVKESCDSLNEFLINQAITRSDITYLISSVSGSGFEIDRFGQLFLLAMSSGCDTVEELTQFVLDTFESNGEIIFKNGMSLAKYSEKFDEVSEHALYFKNKKIPILKALGIA